MEFPPPKKQSEGFAGEPYPVADERPSFVFPPPQSVDPSTPFEVAEQVAGKVVELQDGMTELNDRVDLMSEVSGYGGMVMSKSVRMKVNDYRRVPFDLQYGPPKNTTVDTVNNRIYLAKGTWSISWIIAMQQSDLGNTEIWNRPRIDVFSPDGSLYTRRWLDHASMRYPDAAFFQTIVVTPDAGYYTEAWFTADAFRVLYGGTDRSVFWANRWDINSDNAPSVVDPPVVDVT